MRLWISLLSFGVLIAAGAWFWTQRPQPPEPKPVQEAPQRSLEGTDVSFTITQGSVKKWVIHAGQAKYFEDASGADLTDVSGEVFNEKGQAVAHFQAPTGTFYQNPQKVVLSGGVLATAGEDVQMTAPTMTWSTKGEDALAEGGVRLERKGFGISRAQQCRFTLDFARVSLQGQAQTEMAM
jgi:LPS export ABC transporter protein LptC